MKRRNLAGTTALLALLSGTAAIAQVTPEEVWQNWQDLGTSSGQTIAAGAVTRVGDTLVVENVTSAFAKDGATVALSIDELNFRDLGDGTVEVTMSETFPLKMSFPAEAGAEDPAATDVTIEFSQPGMMMTVSGNAVDTSYDFLAPSAGIKLTSIDGVDAADIDLTVDATMTGVSGNYSVAGGPDAKVLDSSLAVQSLALAVVGADPKLQSNFRMAATIADISGATKGNLIGAEAMADLAAALKAGFTSEGNFKLGALSFDIDATEAGAPTKIVGSAASAEITFAMDASRLQYGSGSKDFSLTIMAPGIPFPEVKVNYAEASFNILMPLTKSDTPADFGLLARVVGLSISDEVWGMIDPAASLPRDPATVIIDTKGSVTLTHDIMDPVQMAALGDAPPGLLNSLEITELKATVAGADLSGQGAFTFDNSDTTTFGGVPAPTGKIELKLLGGNGLMDKLVAMGVLSQEDVTGARFMASMFANAGPGEDELNSTIEFKDKGLFANGQQLQ